MPPSITSVIPNTGLTRGWAYVEIEGTGIDFHVVPAANTPLPIADPGPAVSVKFGGVEARNIRVVDEGANQRIYCNVPAFGGDYDLLPLAVDVEVENLLTGGSDISIGAFTFTRENLTRESDFVRLIREVVSIFRRQTIRNVSIRTHRDYDDDVSDGFNIPKRAKLPSIILNGPTLDLNTMAWRVGREDFIADGGEDGEEREYPRVWDLGFSCRVDCKSLVESLNIQNSIIRMFDVTTEIEILADPLVPGEFVSYEIEPPRSYRWNNEGGSADIVGFEFDFVIEAVPIDEDSPLIVYKTKTVGDQEPDLFIESKT